MARFCENLIYAALIWLAAAIQAGAACSEPDREGDLIVGIRDAQPFTYQSAIGPAGFAVDAWEVVAQSIFRNPDNAPSKDEMAGMNMEERAAVLRKVAYVTCDTIDEQEAAMAAGLIDVVISPLTITAARMQDYDFSTQYLKSGLTLARPESSAIDFREATDTIVDTLFQSNVLSAIIAFLLFNLVMAYLIRRILLADEPLGWFSAKPMFEAIMRTIGLKGVGSSYTTAIAKSFEIFMAIVGTALSATILGVLTTAFVGSVGKNDTIPPSEFTKMRIATLKCSTAQTFLYDQYAKLKTTMQSTDPLMPILDERMEWLACPEDTPIVGPAEMSEPTGLPGAVVLARSWEEAVRMLANEEVDAVLGDWIALTYQARQPHNINKVDVQERAYRNEPYGWAIARKPGSDTLRRQIDRALIAEVRHPGWNSLVEDKLGTGSVSPN